MTLDDHLARAYGWDHKLAALDTDPVHDLATAGISRDEILARRADLAAVPEQRCVVSAAQVRFLDRVLDLMA